MIYLFVLFLLIILSIRYDINRKREGRDEWYVVILVIFIIIAGFRWRLGADTTEYLYSFYHRIPTLRYFDIDEMTPGSNPLWIFLNSVVKTLGGRFYVVQIIQAIIVNLLLFIFIKKHTEYIFTCAFFYFIWRYFNMNMQEMKASISIVLCLYGNDYILQKKWVKGYSLYLIGFFFHFSTILIFLTPLLFHLRFNLKGYSVLLLSFIVGYFLQKNYSEYIMIFELDENIASKAELYTDMVNRTEMNYMNLLDKIPKLLYVVFCVLYLRNNKNDNSLTRFEPFVALGIACELVSLNVSIFYRFSHFYSIYFILFYSSCLVEIFKSKMRHSFFVSILGTAIIFLPLFFSISTYYFSRYKMYYPYSSVFVREVNKEREKRYNIKLIRPKPVHEEY